MRLTIVIQASGKQVCCGTDSFFDWPGITPRIILPELLYHDFDGDGTKELAVTLYHGSGTGVAMMDLVILKIEESKRAHWDKPVYTEFMLSAFDIHEWIGVKFSATIAEDQKAFYLDVLGRRYTLSEDMLELALEYPFTGAILFGNIVYFRFEGTQIRTEIAFGMELEGIAGPAYFGDIEASVTFDGKNLKLEDYSFRPY